MEYGPRGLPRQKYFAVVHADGLAIDEQVFSVSYAAVYCMNKAGSPRKTANGWVLWRTMSGDYLDTVYTKLQGAKTEPDQAASISLDA